MEKPFHLLILDDSPQDIELITVELQRAGLQFQCVRVETEAELRSELDQAAPDLIISDHGLPGFSGLAALALARSLHGDIPFIFVTGAMGEDTAIRAFEDGATDYVLKGHLARLPGVVQRALEAAQERARRKQADAEREELIRSLQAALAKVKSLSGLLPICASCKKIRDPSGQWHLLEEYLQKNSNATLSHGLCPDCARAFIEEINFPTPRR